MGLYHKNNVFNLMRVVYYPIIMTTLLVLGMGMVSIYLNNKNLMSQYREEGLLFASQISSQLSRNIESQKYAESILEDKIRVAALTILEIEKLDVLSNSILIEMLHVLDVSELHYMDKQTRILFSTIEGYLGWTHSREHPLYDFVESTDVEMMESIRLDDKYKKPMKYGAIKSDSGSFIQVGIDAEIVQYAKNQFSYQSIIDDISDNPKIRSVQFSDVNLDTIAYSGYDYSTKPMNLDLKYFSSPKDIWIGETPFSKDISEGYGFYIPVFHDDFLFGILYIDYSLEQFSVYNRQVIRIHAILMMCLILILVTFQYYNIIIPVQDLEKNIKQIDVTKNVMYKLPTKRKKAFYGIENVINEILSNTYGFIFELNETKEELESSNEELSAAYQQIQASEQVLRDQYDEIIEQKQYIEHIAFYDELTALPNRHGFVKWLKEKLPKEQQGAVLLIGIDNFKGINNTLGHLFGDQVLKSVAKLIKESSSSVYAARFSGDEFIIYLNGFNEMSDIDHFTKNLMRKLKSSVEVDFKKIYITTSIGISVYPNDSTEINKLIMNADSAVYKVKEKGKNGYLYFNDEMIQSIAEKSKIETCLRDAIESDLFKLVYQPQVSLLTGEVVGLEALLRLKNNAYSPDVFIPVAENIGAIIPIGRWVAKSVVKQMASWREQGFKMKTVAINFSPIQLKDTEFHMYLNDLLLQYDVPSKYIEIEVTENILIESMDEALNYLNKFKDLNIKLALDDFGTGFSSINYLSSLPISKVKLDKSVIWKYTSEENEEVIKSLIGLSKCFNLSLVAEGVEDEVMLSMLKRCGGDIVQGYYYSKPIDVEQVHEVVKMIEQGN